MRESGFRRAVGSLMGGGLRGPTNVASWLVAGTLAYFLWVKPKQDLQQQLREKAALAAAAASDPNRKGGYISNPSPSPSPSPHQEENNNNNQTNQ